MNRRIAILADIHANLTALEAVISDMRSQNISSVMLLGDLVNYGPRPDQVIRTIKSFEWPVLVNIWGNHEYSLFEGNLERFATDRGRAVLNYTKGIISGGTWDYLRGMKEDGIEEVSLGSVSFLCIHGTLEDPYWGKFSMDMLDNERFQKYDYVLTAHSHIPYYIEHFFQCDNPAFRNKKRIVFINPGSVGQPRNHCPQAQYGLLDLDTGEYVHRCVEYDIAAEQALFNDKIDFFYKERLSKGI